MSRRSVRRDGAQNEMYVTLKDDVQLFESYKDVFMAALMYGYTNERRKKIKNGPEILLGIFSSQDIQFMKMIMYLEKEYELFSTEDEAESADMNFENFEIIEEYAAGGLEGLYHELQNHLSDSEAAQNAYLDLMMKYENQDFSTEDLINELPLK
ncbi:MULTISPECIES: hypothetical protein [unclassified Exiguobacterium]|uniref:hypothetical protein n=1 Tax=unclassified Exiguobacterium TaxID=2644629 RepID=UPI001BEA8F98|nr:MULTISPECIES: hypothetical protein [unclassified Exiguobacterium]